MTDKQWQELGRRAVACKGWRWMPGMVAFDDPLRIVEYIDYTVSVDGELIQWTDASEQISFSRFVPDLRDPATLGCLLAMVREAWEGQFTVCGEAQLTPQALVAALEVIR